MENTSTNYYPELWCKIDFTLEETMLSFRVYEMTSMIEDEEDASKSDFAEKSMMDGFIKWDGCCEINYYDIHFCGISEAENHFKIIKQIYAYAKGAIPYNIIELE